MGSLAEASGPRRGSARAIAHLAAGDGCGVRREKASGGRIANRHREGERGHQGHSGAPQHAWQAPPAESTRYKVTKAKKPSANATTNRREASDRRKAQDERRTAAIAVANERRTPSERREKVNRRRQIDPTTCERDYTDQEVEFMHALDQYKRTSGRMFPTCSEILEVIRDLGYEKLPRGSAAAHTHEMTAV